MSGDEHIYSGNSLRCAKFVGWVRRGRISGCIPSLLPRLAKLPGSAE